jgi:hypothetical protein
MDSSLNLAVFAGKAAVFDQLDSGSQIGDS